MNERNKHYPARTQLRKTLYMYISNAGEDSFQEAPDSDLGGNTANYTALEGMLGEDMPRVHHKGVDMRMPQEAVHKLPKEGRMKNKGRVGDKVEVLGKGAVWLGREMPYREGQMKHSCLVASWHLHSALSTGFLLHFFPSSFGVAKSYHHTLRRELCSV